jgi:hypothetical protein
MSDDTSRQGTADRTKVSAGQGYEVHYFAQKHGISVEQAREMIRANGTSREKLRQTAKQERG